MKGKSRTQRLGLKPFQPDLDVVQHINQLFPTEQSLAGLDDTMVDLTCQVGKHVMKKHPST